MKALILLSLLTPAFCQQSFTVASVKPAASGKPAVTIDPGRVQYSNITLAALITRAYGVKFYQVTGPDWIASSGYTVTATMPRGTPDTSVAQMLQALLAERFQLKLRRTSQEMPIYAIVTGKGGPKLKQAAGGEPSYRFSSTGIVAKNATLDQLANTLGKLLDRPIVDRTELRGTYDITLEFAPDATLGPGMAKMSAELAASKSEATGPSVFTAFQQLGLKLEPMKAPIEVLTVESALKVPTEN